MRLKLFIVWLVSFGVIHAQENTPDSVQFHPSALLFNIENFKLNSFNGGMGIKFWLSKNVALLSKIKYSHSKDKLDATTQLSGSDNFSTGYGISFGGEKHLTVAKTISPYVAVTAGFDHNVKQETIIPPDYLQPNYSSQRKTEETSYSFYFSFGAEYFLSNNVSLSGQYNVGVMTGLSEETYETYYSAPTTMNASSLDYGISSGELIIAVYF
jgi:hypothetical protein